MTCLAQVVQRWGASGKISAALGKPSGLILCAGIVASLAFVIPAFYRVEPLAGLLLLPYLAWATFALFLNSTLINLNPQVREHLDGQPRHSFCRASCGTLASLCMTAVAARASCQESSLVLQEFTPKELKADAVTGKAAAKVE